MGFGSYCQSHRELGVNVETMTEVAHPFFLWNESERQKERTAEERGVTERRGKEKVSEFYETPRIGKHFLWGKGTSFCIKLSSPRRNQLFCFPGENGGEAYPINLLKTKHLLKVIRVKEQFSLMLGASHGSYQHGLQLTNGRWLLAVVAFGRQR